MSERSSVLAAVGDNDPNKIVEQREAGAGGDGPGLGTSPPKTPMQTSASTTDKYSEEESTPKETVKITCFAYNGAQFARKRRFGGMCCEKMGDLYTYMHTEEERFSVPEDYLKGVVGVTQASRKDVVLWLLRKFVRLNLMPEVTYMTMSLLDRYIYKTGKNIGDMKLYGLVAMKVASMRQEPQRREGTPEIDAWRDYNYTDKDYAVAEARLVTRLDYDLWQPSPLLFLRRLSRASKASKRRHKVSKYLCEVSMPEYECVQWLPSYRAATASCLAMILRHGDAFRWSPSMAWHSFYTEEQLRPGLRTLARAVLRLHKDPDTGLDTRYYTEEFIFLSEWKCFTGAKIRQLAAE